MCQAVVTVHVQLLGVSVCVCFVVASATMHPFPASQPGDDDDDDDHRDVIHEIRPKSNMRPMVLLRPYGRTDQYRTPKSTFLG